MHTTPTAKDFEPSKDLGLIGLIGLIKKSGFAYSTSYGYSFSRGASVRKSYGDDGLFNVSYAEGRSYGEENPPKASDKLCEIAQALVGKGLGVACTLTSDGELRLLSVFAYDVTADLEAYEAKLTAKAREEAKVTPEVKAFRIARAQEYLAEKTREAEEMLANIKRASTEMFETMELRLSVGDAKEAHSQSLHLMKMGASCGDFAKLSWTMVSVATAQDTLNRCEALELKDYGTEGQDREKLQRRPGP